MQLELSIYYYVRIWVNCDKICINLDKKLALFSIDYFLQKQAQMNLNDRLDNHDIYAV